MHGSAARPRLRLMKDVLEIARRIAPKSAQEGLDIFLEAYYSNVGLEDLRERTPEDLAGAAVSHLGLASRREPGEPRVRVYNPTEAQHGWNSTHTIVEVVTDDMPFLVDSLGMVINRHGLYIHLTVHPIIVVRRGRTGRLLAVVEEAGERGAQVESFMRFESSSALVHR